VVVGNGNLRRWDEGKLPVVLDMKEVLFKFRQLVGPEKTINNQDQPFATFLKSLEFK